MAYYLFSMLFLFLMKNKGFDTFYKCLIKFLLKNVKNHKKDVDKVIYSRYNN